MDIQARQVGIQRCAAYRRQDVKAAVARLCAALGIVVRSGDRVLLKPNLISASNRNELACTQPQFVAAVAEWFVDHGARVAVGDSPAFGTAVGVMQRSGISEALAGLPVKQRNFTATRRLTLASGISVRLAEAALETDLLVNLPRVKAHSQVYVTLAVKNYFGTVTGLQKPWCHFRYGDRDSRFAALLVDLLEVLPGGVSLADGIVAMQGDGPMNGRPFTMGVVAGSVNPVALDTALMSILNLQHDRSPVWRECVARQLAGSGLADPQYPLLRPAEVQVAGFETREHLQPISFNPCRMVASSVKRLVDGRRR